MVKWQKSSRILSALSLFAVFFAICVIGLGAYTRLMDAGLGCPDWPGCYGQLSVPQAERLLGSVVVAHKAWAEMVHRYFAGSLSLLIAFITVVLCMKPRKPAHLFLAAGLILAVIYQILLGKYTVTLKLLPIIVTQHLLGGYCILSLLWLTYLLQKKQISFPVLKFKKTFIFFASLGFILLVGQIFLGAWTSTNYAALSCASFPFCQADAILNGDLNAAFHFDAPTGPNYEGGLLSASARVSIQIVHRIGALIVTLYFFMFAALGHHFLKRNSQLWQTIFLLLSLFSIQIVLGISNSLFKLPVLTAVSHTLVAVLCVLTYLTLLFNLVRCVGDKS